MALKTSLVDDSIEEVDEAIFSISQCSTSSTSTSTSEHLGLSDYYGRSSTNKVRRRAKSIPLRALARLAVMSVRLCKHSMDNLARRKGEYESVMQVLDEYGAKLNWGGLNFNPKDFRANNQHSLHKGARRLLEIDPKARNENDINTLLVALRNIPAFAEYPKKMQKKLCQVGRLETYEPRRVILREGDPPTSFYFILSGTVLVTAFEENTGTSRTLVALNKGMSFGELAVISNTRRQATVCSKTEIELLCISGQEFEEIFMAGGRDVMSNEKQQDFISRNQVLVRDSNNSDWIYIVLKGSLSVIKKLKKVDPQTDFFLSPKRPRVAFSKSKRPDRLPDVATSDTKVDLPHARRSVRKHRCGPIRTRVDRNDTDVNNNDLTSLSRSWGVKISQTQPRYFKNAMELEHTLEKTLPGYHNTVDRLGSLDYDRIIGEHKAKLTQKSPFVGGKRQGEFDSEDDPSIGSKNSSFANELFPSSQENNLVTIGFDLLPSIPSRDSQHSKEKTSRGVIQKSSILPDISITNGVNNRELDYPRETINVGKGHKPEMYDDDGHDADNEDRSSTSSFTSLIESKSYRKKSKRIRKTSKGVYLASSRKETEAEEANREGEQRLHNRPSDIKSGGDESYFSDDSHWHDNVQKGESISDRLAKLQIQYQRRITDGEGRKTIAEELDYKARRDFKFTETDLDPTIIELQVLEKGQYFGLSSILFPDQPSLSVISNGAECVVISKKFFLQLASDKCITALRQTETPYPSDHQLRKKLQEAVNWQASRAAMFSKLQNEVLQKQAKRKQYASSYQGQYCFRTGPA